MSTLATDPASEARLPESELVADLGAGPARRIAVAALELFGDVGFHGTTTRMIAQSAGVSAGAPYSHFASKEELLNLWVLRGHRDALRVAREALGRGASPRERVHHIVHDLTLWHATYAVLSRVASSQLRALTPAHYAVVRELRREIEECLRVPVAQGTGSGLYQAHDPDLVISAIFGLIRDVARWVGARRADLDTVATEYAALAQRMLTAQPADHA